MEITGGEGEFIIPDSADNVGLKILTTVFAGGLSVKKTHFPAGTNAIRGLKLHDVVGRILRVEHSRRNDAPRSHRAKSRQKTRGCLHRPETGRKEKAVLIRERERRTIQRAAIKEELFRARRLLRRQRKAKTEKSCNGEKCAFGHGENSPPKRRARQQNLWAEEHPPEPARFVGRPLPVAARRNMQLRSCVFARPP